MRQVQKTGAVWSGVAVLLLLQWWSGSLHAADGRCLLLYSYHSGYEWNDGIDRGATEVLTGKCEIRRFFLDSKRKREPEEIRQKAREALELIESWQPDVVIAADDNASQYVVEPHLKGGKIPVLFCGINWEAKRYGYPASNITGMVEVSAIVPLMKLGLQMVSGRHVKAHFLAADVVTERKEFDRFEREFAQRGVKLKPHFVETFEQWKAAYREIQQPGALLVLSNHAGIRQWDQAAAERWVAQHSEAFTFSPNPWMSTLSHVTMGKVAEEQGEWAAQKALAILRGTDVGSIPMTTNKLWKLDVNRALLEKNGFRLPLWIEKRLKR